MKTKSRRATVWFVTLLIACLAACTPQQDTDSNSTKSVSDTPHSLPPVATSSESTTTAVDEPTENPPATVPNISVSLVNYQQLMAAIKKHEGKIVVLDIWSNSCAPCLREFPHLVKLSQRWPHEIRCVSLNIDYIGLKSKPPESYTSKVEAFVNAQRAEFENFQATETDESILKSFQLESIPGIVLYHRDGTSHAKFTEANSGEGGLTYQGVVIPAIEKLLSQQ